MSHEQWRLIKPMPMRRTKVRDRNFYFTSTPDVQCVVLEVENILFSLPRILLTAASSLFRDVLDQSHFTGRGESDAGAIIVYDVSAIVFRALCRALYAPPQRIQEIDVPLNSLLQMAKAADLLGFEHILKSLLRNIEFQVLNKHDKVALCSLHTFDDLARFLLSLGEDASLETLLDVWIDAIDTQLGLPVPHRSDSFVRDKADALDFGDQFKGHPLVLDFLISLYGMVLSDALFVGSRAETSDIFTFSFPMGSGFGLSEKHTLRLLTGYYNLSNHWCSLRTQDTPALIEIPGCRCHDECQRKWDYIWDEMADQYDLDPAGVQHHLKEIRLTLYDMTDPERDLPDCWDSRTQSMLEVEQILQNKLPYYFLGPDKALLPWLTRK